jgi:hypothetical protein
MANLMEDLASGSSSVLQLQKNVAAGPDVQQVQKNVMQEQALKLQQEQANLDKTKLDNMVTDTNFKAGEEAKVKLQALTKSEDFKKASPIEQAKMANLVVGESGNIKEFSSNLASIELAEQRQAVAKQREMDTQAQSINSALSNINTIPKEELEGYVSRLPETVTKPAIAAVGQGNWDKFTPEQKKQALIGMMHTGKMQLQAQIIEGALKKQEIISKSNEKRATITAAWHGKTKAMGGGGSKEEIAIQKMYDAEEKRVDQIAAPVLKDLTKRLTDLQAQAAKEKVGFFFDGDPKASTTAEIKAVTDQIDKVTKNKNDALMKLAKRLPESSFRTRLLHEHDVVDTTVTPPPAAPKPAAKDTSNKSKPTADQQAIVTKAEAAIKAGADPEKVKARLKEAGIPGY